jgi:hypothetical protein
MFITNWILGIRTGEDVLDSGACNIASLVKYPWTNSVKPSLNIWVKTQENLSHFH